MFFCSVISTETPSVKLTPSGDFSGTFVVEINNYLEFKSLFYDFINSSDSVLPLKDITRTLQYENVDLNNSSQLRYFFE